VFWFGFEIPWAKLLVFRVLVFGLLAVDSILQISHAPRYGAGSFNVAHLPGLDALGAGRVGYEAGQLVCAYLFVLAVVGVATRLAVPIAAVIYAWLYFGSQLDSYQHHYLVALALVVASFVPWERPADARPDTPVRAWALRLLLVQLGIMYLWAAVSKLSPAWLDGRTLATQISGGLRSWIDGSVGFAWAARLTVVVELVLAVAIWLRPAWIVALPLGVALHVGIVASELEIGLFAYLMLAFYVLLVPDRLWVALARLAPARALATMTSAIRTDTAAAAWVALAVAVAGSVGVAAMTHLHLSLVVGLVLCIVPLALGVASRRAPRRVAAIGLAHLFAIAVWLVVDRASTTAVDYYRFWGGSQRRLGAPVIAERAYRRLVEIAPDEPAGHYQLGRLLLTRGEEAAGLAALHEAQRLEPRRARAWIAEARYLAAKGRTAEAVEKAREATYAEPGHAGARDLLDTLTRPQRAPGGAPSPDDDTP